MESKKETNIFAWLDGPVFNRFHTLMLLLAGLILAGAGMNLQILAYAMPLIVKEWALSSAKASAMISWGFFGLMVDAVGFGAVADRTGRKKALMAAISVFLPRGECGGVRPRLRKFL